MVDIRQAVKRGGIYIPDRYQKKLVHFCQYDDKWSEIKLLTRDFVSSAARR